MGAIGEVLSPADIYFLVIFLVALAGVTAAVNRKVGAADSEHYFLGGREIPWWAIGLSLFASNIGTDHLVGLAGSGAASGIVVGLIELNACYFLLVLGWVFVPRYVSMNIFTVPEFLERRFDSSFRTSYAIFVIAATIVTKISVTIFAGATVLEQVAGWDMWVSSLILLTLTGIYTAIGGLAVVMYTEVMQSAVLLFGSAALLWIGLAAVGGWSGLKRKLPANHFTIVRPLDDVDYPWLGVLFGLPITSLWYWCCDQVMVQRVLAGKSVRTSQQGCVLAAWFKLVPMFIMVVPGMIAVALYPDDVSKDTNAAYALLVTRLMPDGLRGPMVAVMLSSFMASLASCFNSCSTVFTMDVYLRLRPEAPETDLVQKGRLFTLGLAAASLCWLPVIKMSPERQLFLYIQKMQIVWVAPISAVFLATCISDKVSSRAAWLTLAITGPVGLLFWVFNTIVPAERGVRFLHGMNYLYFSEVHFLLSVAILVAVSIAEKLRGPEPGAEGESQALPSLVDAGPYYGSAGSRGAVAEAQDAGESGEGGGGLRMPARGGAGDSGAVRRTLSGGMAEAHLRQHNADELEPAGPVTKAAAVVVATIATGIILVFAM